MEMNTFKVYTKKTTPLLIFSTSLLFLLIYLFTGSVNSSPLYVLVVLLLVTILIVNFFLIIDNRPSIVLTRNKIILPKKMKL